PHPSHPAAPASPPAPPASHLALRVHDLGDLLLMPGLVDTHVHVNDPGRTEWEGFATASAAAAAGGITTIVDMPLNSVPATTDVPALERKREAARAAMVNVEFWGGVVPGNAGELDALADAGVRGFKCFLSPSPRAEVDAIALLISLCREYGTHIHVVHLAAREALPLLRDARAEGLPITVETCPHYLTFCADEIGDGATLYKCAPPIREREHRDALWRALEDGTIDLIATDHSPCPPSMKGEGDFVR